VSTLARVLAAAVFAVSLPAHALQDFDACVVAEGSAGTVESVRLVPRPRDLHAFDAEVLEHSLRPEEAQELVVRLDAGPLVVFSQRQPLALHAGQRVRVHLDGSAARVDRDFAC
jgi:hypothetical protein